MRSEGLNKAFRIWIAPLSVYLGIVVCMEFIASTLFPGHVEGQQFTDKGVRDYELFLTYTLGGFFIGMCWVMIKQFEKIKGKFVRRGTKRLLKILTIAYFVSLCVILAGLLSSCLE